MYNFSMLDWLAKLLTGIDPNPKYRFEVYNARGDWISNAKDRAEAHDLCDHFSRKYEEQFWFLLKPKDSGLT